MRDLAQFYGSAHPDVVAYHALLAMIADGVDAQQGCNLTQAEWLTMAADAAHAAMSRLAQIVHDHSLARRA